MFNFIYDVSRQGYDNTLWKTLGGTPSALNGELTINAAEIIQYADCLRGVFSFKVELPAAPIAGDKKEIGLISVNKDAKLMFVIDGVDLTLVAQNTKGKTELTIPWVAEWSTNPALYQIKWGAQGATFLINGEQVASFQDNVSMGVLSPYINNEDSDDLKVTYVEGSGIEAYL